MNESIKHIPSVLVIDDNDVDVFLAREVMRRNGGFGKVYSAVDGLEAIELFRDVAAARTTHGVAFPPKLILLDINMPRMDGFEFLAEFESIHSGSTDRPIVIMMLTSSDNERDRDRAAEFGVVDEFATKPITLAMAEKVLDRYGTEVSTT